MTYISNLRHLTVRLFFTVISIIFIGLYKFGIIKLSHSICYVVEGNNWVVSRIGNIFSDYYKNFPQNFFFYLSRYPVFSASKILHFGSPHLWLRWHKYCKLNNTSIVNFYHGSTDPNYGNPDFINAFISSASLIDVIVTSCTLTKSRLLSWGIPPSKIVVIPLGIDFSRFHGPESSFQRISPPNEFYIGSFQKDSIGWGSSSLPKLIKGPDLFAQTVSILSKSIPNIHVLLTGPSRDYLKNTLSSLNIKYTHVNNVDSSLMAFPYNCIDLYLITSREEGGPLALLESLASNVPVVTTPCGMAVDLPSSPLLNVVGSFEANDLANCCLSVLRSGLKHSNTNNSHLESICDWKSILPIYSKLYSVYLD